MKQKITILTALTIVFMLSGMGNSPVLAQNHPPVHGIGEVYEYSLGYSSGYSDSLIGDAYDLNLTNFYNLVDRGNSTNTRYGDTRLTYFGPEYNSLIDQYTMGNSTYGNGTYTLDQYEQSVYVQEETNETSSNSYSYENYEWRDDVGIIRNNSYSTTWGPQNDFYTSMYSVFFNQTYSTIFGSMYMTPGVYETYSYIYPLGISVTFQYTLTVSIINVMAEFTINGQTSMYSVNLVNITSFGQAWDTQNATVYLGETWDTYTPYGTFPVNVNTTFYESVLIYFDAVDTRMLQYDYFTDVFTEYSVDATRPMTFNGYNGTYIQDVTVSMAGSQYNYVNDEMTITSFYPAPVPEGTNRLMTGDMLNFGTYMNENRSSYMEYDGNFSTSWSQVDRSTEGYGTTTLEVAYHRPGSFGAVVYGGMDLYTEETYTNAYGSNTNSWNGYDTFFDFLPYLESSDTQDIVIQPEPFYFAEQIPYDIVLPLTNTSVEYDQIDVVINGLPFTLDVEIMTSMYYLEFSGYADARGGPAAYPGEAYLNLTASALIASVVDVNTGAFIGQVELLYAYYTTLPNGTYGVTYQEDIIEYEYDMVLQSHPYFYTQATTTSTVSNSTTTDTVSSNTTTTTDTVSSNTTTTSEPANNTSSIAPPTNPLPGFEFVVASFSIVGIAIVFKRTRKV